MSIPKAKQESKILEAHGDQRHDEFYWLNQRENPEVRKYLEEENAYYKKETQHLEDFTQDLFQEMKSRIKEDDSSVPYFLDGYWYQAKFEKGKDYPIYTRRKDHIDAEEKILFDVNQMAEGFDYYKLSGISISPDNKLAAFGVDNVSRREYTIHIKDIETGEILDQKIEKTTGSSCWASDNKTLFYTRKDPQTLRSHQIYKHHLDQNNTEDELVYQEDDATFNTYVFKSKSRDFIIIGSSSTLQDEYRFISANKPNADFKIIQKRTPNLEYSVAHYEDYFYILTNKGGASNFRLMRTPIDKTEVEHWEDVISHRDDVLLEDADIFKNYLVLTERFNGLTRLRVLSWDLSEDYFVPISSETYTLGTSSNPDFETDTLRYVYSSLTTPTSVIDFNMKDQTEVVMKQSEVLDPDFKASNYIAERAWATAADGVKIPMSIVYKKGIQRDGKNPLLQYGYGSYGHTVDPYFSSTRLSLLDRGFVFVIAHIRGSEYLGRQWYEDGKLLKKKNTFSDFIAVSEYLIEHLYTSPEHLYAMGGSAGGLLVGAVMNTRPDLYHGMIAAVPFVDVVTTMLDDSIPLTTGEYDEWGNPNDAQYYHYIKSYSPYDNIKDCQYPHLLVTTGFYDSQVQYWEPAKWVARLRLQKNNTNKVYLETNMKTGHGGASGRFEALKELAKEYAFIFELAGILK
ncbi:S9 family peptidase [Psychroflexus halocasei]|uniref:Proline-specific endopeptidase n=1 Tax=Psychroflexus halocasei TaxID=908615 RepID=A0A1H3YIJ1_9FLAO|nr:S9 family peptidase [Psychroflexus halocasei]SEA11439.1 oligopeptidase B [Psychroflexus halocasei]